MTSRDDSVGSAWRADLVLLVVVLIWGVNIPVMKGALSELHPFAFNLLRLSLSAVLLGSMDAMERRRRRGAPANGTVSWRMIVFLGLVGSLLYQVLFLVGIDHTTAGNTGLLVGTVPLWTAVIASLCGIDRKGWIDVRAVCGQRAVGRGLYENVDLFAGHEVGVLIAKRRRYDLAGTHGHVAAAGR